MYKYAHSQKDITIIITAITIIIAVKIILTIAELKIPATGPTAEASFKSIAASSWMLTFLLDTTTLYPFSRHLFRHS